ncbi:hypothetical protein Gotur_025040, partial [Gossypium turneri]
FLLVIFVGNVGAAAGIRRGYRGRIKHRQAAEVEEVKGIKTGLRMKKLFPISPNKKPLLPSSILRIITRSR